MHKPNHALLILFIVRHLLKITEMYSEKLIKEVKECYQTMPEIHKLADEGSVWLGRYLDDRVMVMEYH